MAIDIETLAVNEISDRIAMCPCLSPVIMTNDKTPLFDGHIDVYRSGIHSRAEWDGKVDVQVKGRKTPDSKATQKKFRIDRSDLLAYQSASGVLFFVVFIDPETGNKHPRYALLSPYAIEGLLSKASPRSKSIAVPLKEMPASTGELQGIVGIALKAQAERPNAGDTFALFPLMQSLTIHTATNLDFDAPIQLIPGETDYTLSLNTAEGISLPVGGELRIFPAAYSPRQVDVTTSCGEVVFEKATVRKVSEVSLEVVLSPGVTLIISDLGHVRSMDIRFTSVGSLPERVRTLEFYRTLLEGHPLHINGEPSTFLLNDEGDDQQLAHLDYLYKLTELFDLLNVDTNLINLDEIDDRQHSRLQHLYEILLKGKEFSQAGEETGVLLVEVGRWRLMLLFVHGENGGSWRCIDPFSPEGGQFVKLGRREEGSNAEYVPVTAYEAIEREHFPLILNLRLENIVNAYEAIVGKPDTFSFANQMVLSLILAADTVSERSVEMLGGAMKLNDWLIDQEVEEAHHLVNRWQIMWRQDTLSSEARRDIRKLKHEISRSDIRIAKQIELACALLLGDAEETEYYLGVLSEEERAQVETWPIWALRNAAPAVTTVGALGDGDMVELSPLVVESSISAADNK